MEGSVLDYMNQVIPANIKLSIHMVNPNQEFQPINQMLDELVVRAWNSGITEKEMAKLSPYLTNLKDQLNFIRYHQRNFLFRLRLLNLEQIPLKPIRGNASVVMIDIALRCELESFVSKLRSCLDVMAKLISYYLNTKDMKHGSLLKHLEGSNISLKKRFLAVYLSNLEWFEEIKNIRDKIIHDGTFDAFRGFEHINGFISQPQLNNFTAEHFCFKQWKKLWSFTNDLLFLLYPIPE